MFMEGFCTCVRRPRGEGMWALSGARSVAVPENQCEYNQCEYDCQWRLGSPDSLRAPDRGLSIPAVPQTGELISEK